METPRHASGGAHRLGILRLRGWFALRTIHFAQDDNGYFQDDGGLFYGADQPRLVVQGVDDGQDGEAERQQ